MSKESQLRRRGTAIASKRCWHRHRCCQRQWRQRPQLPLLGWWALLLLLFCVLLSLHNNNNSICTAYIVLPSPSLRIHAAMECCYRQRRRFSSRLQCAHSLPLLLHCQRNDNDDESSSHEECKLSQFPTNNNSSNLPSIAFTPWIFSTTSTTVKTRRKFILQPLLFTTSIFPLCVTHHATASTDLPGDGYFSLRNNNNMPNTLRRQQQLQQQQQRRQREWIEKTRDRTTSSSSSSSLSKKWIPFANVKRWDSVETCLLEMLPVKNIVFRQLQEFIENIQVFSSSVGTSTYGWKQQALYDSIAVLAFLNSKRSSLEPVFNQDDPTELYIAKSSLGEKNVERLRSILEEMIDIASGEDERTTPVVKRRNSSNNNNENDDNNNNSDSNINVVNEGADSIDSDAFLDAKRRALMALSELGELLVPSFPFAVPTRGKFGYLPRLLGRCTVTFSFERPSSSSSSSSWGGNNYFGGNDNKQVLGNVTIVADGYAAPITAGNFVDLSARNFYTGLSVRAMRKRLGLVPITSDNVILNDLTELKDNFDELKDSALEFPETLKKDGTRAVGNDRGGDGRESGKLLRPEDVNNDPLIEPMYNRMTTDVVLPILGSFQEGFYDPLTAKPRRIPLEIVTFDRTSPTKSTLTYSSSYASLDDNMSDFGTTRYSGLSSSSSSQRSFSSATSSSPSGSTTAKTTGSSNLDPVLSFDIPGLVALNHPDRASNGGSSEFFALPWRDSSSKIPTLLDGQYAPFGYIVSGLDVYQSLRPGDIIKATYVSEIGLLNLVKIRKNAFEGGEESTVIKEDIGSES